MSFSLFVEWEKNRPLGPLLRFEWKLDDKGRFVKVPDTDDPLEMCTHPLPEDPSQHAELLGQPCGHVLHAMPAAHWSLILAMGLMHCKNVAETEITPSEREQRAYRRRAGRPLTRYSTIDIGPIRKAVERERTTRNTTLGKAIHLCRGHFKTFRPEAPLFGKLTGQYFWNYPVRGNPKNGQVSSEYRVHAPADSGLVGLVYEAKEPLPVGPDPDLTERGRDAHDNIQNLLAEALICSGITPLRPAPHEPQYDLAWRRGDHLWVVEVKSLTDVNERRQLRWAIGQVLHYVAELRADGHQAVTPVIALEREPRDAGLVAACRNNKIPLLWPEIFPDAAALVAGNGQEIRPSAP
jgi:hypothetical protein